MCRVDGPTGVRAAGRDALKREHRGTLQPLRLGCPGGACSQQRVLGQIPQPELCSADSSLSRGLVIQPTFREHPQPLPPHDSSALQVRTPCSAW